MKQIAYFFLLLGSVLAAQADTMTLTSGQVIKGRFKGYDARKFSFKAEDGAEIFETPSNIKSIVPTTPLKVNVDFARNQYEDVEFRSFDNLTVRLARSNEVINERVIMLKALEVIRPPVSGKARPPAQVEAEARMRREMTETPSAPPREWQRSGKWREMESKNASIISQGEDVDVEACLKKGFINIVHFHYPKALASVREGNYIEALAAKPSNRIVILKVMAPDFKAPICEALGIKSLPQFWFYDAQGRLVKKLTDRFTEGDIDGALKQARH